MHAGATALAILAHRPEAGILEALTDTTLTSAASLEQALDDVRERGYAVSRNQMNLSASALAAPIYTPTGVTNSVGVIAPQQRFDDAKEATMADAVVAAASELGRRLGDPVLGLRGLTGATR